MTTATLEREIDNTVRSSPGYSANFREYLEPLEEGRVGIYNRIRALRSGAPESEVNNATRVGVESLMKDLIPSIKAGKVAFRHSVESFVDDPEIGISRELAIEFYGALREGFYNIRDHYYRELRTRDVDESSFLARIDEFSNKAVEYALKADLARTRQYQPRIEKGLERIAALTAA